MKTILMTLVSMIAINAQAGILIEPFIGYGASTVKTETVAGVPGADSPNGIGMGLRLGYKFMLPWVALDYRLSSGEEVTDSTTLQKIKAEQTQLGVTAGVDLPLIRLFAGYGFDNKFTIKPTTGDAVFKGSYTKVGAGMSILPFVKLNLEYIMNTYSKISSGGSEFDRSASYNKFEHNTVFLSVSAPFNL